MRIRIKMMNMMSLISAGVCTASMEWPDACETCVQS